MFERISHSRVDNLNCRRNNNFPVTVAKKASCRIGIVRPRNSKPNGIRRLSVFCIYGLNSVSRHYGLPFRRYTVHFRKTFRKYTEFFNSVVPTTWLWQTNSKADQLSNEVKPECYGSQMARNRLVGHYIPWRHMCSWAYENKGAAVAERLACSPRTKANLVHSRVFSHVGIVPDDAAGRSVFSGISRLPHHFIPALIHTYLDHPHRLSRPRCEEPPKSLCNEPSVASTRVQHARIVKETFFPRQDASSMRKDGSVSLDSEECRVLPFSSTVAIGVRTKSGVCKRGYASQFYSANRLQSITKTANEVAVFGVPMEDYVGNASLKSAIRLATVQMPGNSIERPASASSHISPVSNVFKLVPSRLSEMSTEQCRFTRAGETGDPRKKPTDQRALSPGTIRKCENSGAAPPGIEQAWCYGRPRYGLSSVNRAVLEAFLAIYFPFPFCILPLKEKKRTTHDYLAPKCTDNNEKIWCRTGRHTRQEYLEKYFGKIMSSSLELSKLRPASTCLRHCPMQFQRLQLLTGNETDCYEFCAWDINYLLREREFRGGGGIKTGI
ncbi:hypothetical protein PR048_007218 [Dryococelus australis]|uniref:Uncharacterized protein n=1 Tax=Dryococelus australis TaxID=614101 RepID=A0ABQ9IE08_9NEOP|nr:hypothetical protein PR048_007218 [Dryococelus australis]